MVLGIEFKTFTAVNLINFWVFNSLNNQVGGYFVFC